MRSLDPRLLRHARAARALLYADVAIGVGVTVLVLAQATLLGSIVGRMFDGATLAQLAPSLVLLLAAFAARGACAWGFEVAGRHAAARVLSQLRLALVEQRLRHQSSALDGVEAGEVAAAGVDGVDALRTYFARYLPQLVLACIVPFAVLAWVARFDLLAALVMLLTLPLVPVFMWLVGHYTAARTRERWLSLRLLAVHFLDVVRGLPTLAAFNRSAAQATTVAEVSERYRIATMGTLRVSFLSGAVLELAATLGVALVAVIVGVRLASGGVGLQAALTVLVLAPELYAPLRQLGAQFHASADGAAVADRICDLLDAPPTVQADGTRRAPDPSRASVRFEGVEFSYPARPGPVLEGLDLELRPGEMVALVGESGCGKSTAASLLLRLAEPTAGRISVGGVDLAACETRAWRRGLAWLPQRPLLLRGTVADNIRLGVPGADDSRVQDAAALAGADAFVRALPSGYATPVGEGGRTLSAGERQRIALARAFLRDAPLVILDEPTANLDPASAALVRAAIGRLRTGRTLLVIAHDAELEARADRVIRLVEGRAVEGSVVAA